jgi:uncharacterized protein YybS (DUF2232 family)
MKFTHVMGCAGSAILLLFASAWIPFIGPFFSLLTPLPFLYYTTKLGIQQGLKMMGITIVIVGLISKLEGYPQLIFFCLEFSLLGLIISEIYRREFTFSRTIFWGASFMLLLGAVSLFLVGLSKEMGPLELILDYFQSNLAETIKAYENTGLDQEKVVHLEEYGKVVTNLVIKIYPALVIIGTGFIVWLNVVISRPLFRRGKIKYPDFGPMDRWQAPEFMVWGVIAAGFTLFLSRTGIKLFAINSLIVMSVIYVFHGLSIVLFFLNRYHVPRWVRFGVYLLIVFQQIILVGLAMAGLFDQWIDFRKIHKKRVN